MHKFLFYSNTYCRKRVLRKFVVSNSYHCMLLWRFEGPNLDVNDIKAHNTSMGWEKKVKLDLKFHFGQFFRLANEVSSSNQINVSFHVVQRAPKDPTPTQWSLSNRLLGSVLVYSDYFDQNNNKETFFFSKSKTKLHPLLRKIEQNKLLLKVFNRFGFISFYFIFHLQGVSN